MSGNCETLAVIKNPQPVAFVRQANIANGPQQVNNAPAPAGRIVRARGKRKSAEQTGGKKWRTAGIWKGRLGKETNSTLEAVGALHGAKDCSR